MHARIDQLLSLRDGEPVDAAVGVHVQQCTQCQNEAARLANVRNGLQSLPPLAPPEDLFARIAARAAVVQPRRRPWAAAAVAATVVVAIVGFVVVRDRSHPPPLVAHSDVEQATTADSDLQALIVQSRELDELLQYLPQRPQVERVSLAATVDSIEERIQVLDWQLAHGADAGLDRRQARRLWSERVELMDSLVKVRYAESAPMTF